jgi:type IV pilus assembly protein PilQ
VNSREANTRVIVKNGQTAVIGGIYRSDVTEGITGVPWLKDIPVLGALFRGTSTDKQRSELLIFLTPRILAQAEGGGVHTGGE